MIPKRGHRFLEKIMRKRKEAGVMRPRASKDPLVPAKAATQGHNIETIVAWLPDSRLRGNERGAFRSPC